MFCIFSLNKIDDPWGNLFDKEPFYIDQLSDKIMKRENYYLTFSTSINAEIGLVHHRCKEFVKKNKISQSLI